MYVARIINEHTWSNSASLFSKYSSYTLSSDNYLCVISVKARIPITFD